VSIDRTTAFINLDNILNNIEKIKNMVSSQCNIMAIVKANAYGHGAVKVATFLEEKGIGYFGVATIDEAIELREAGIKGDILILGYTNVNRINLLSRYNLTQTIHTVEYAIQINSLRNQTKVHIKVDTGMSRLGIYCHQKEDIHKTIELIEGIFKFNNLEINGIYTHFSESDDIDSNFTQTQFELFKKVTDELINIGHNIGLRHCCNSAGTLRFPEMHLDMVRPGILLYGLPPIITKIEFKPVMELKSTVIQVKKMKAGDSIGYGRSYKLNDDRSIATIAIGYADGYSRLLSNNDYVLINGKIAPIIGRVCMDICMVDVTNIDVKQEDEVIIYGNSNNKYKSINEIADKLNTINYEILCSISNRVEREYIY
jgi:alanine racemase